MSRMNESSIFGNVGVKAMISIALLDPFYLFVWRRGHLLIFLPVFLARWETKYNKMQNRTTASLPRLHPQLQLHLQDQI